MQTFACWYVSADTGHSALREPVAKDGTPCLNVKSSNAICIQGICTVRTHNYICVIMYVVKLQPVGCDNVLESGARKDVNGVCNGNDSRTIIRNIVDYYDFGYTTINTIPVRSCDVRITEITVTPFVYLGKFLFKLYIMCNPSTKIYK